MKALQVTASPGWEAILRRDAEAWFAGGDGLPEVRRFEGRVVQFSYRPAGAPGRLFVRRYRHGGLASFLGGAYRGRTRLDREIAFLAALRARGLPVPKAAGGVSRGGAWCELALATEEIEGAVPLIDWLRSPTREGIRRVAAAVRRLSEAAVAHPDLNARNILMRGEEVWFVDFDRAGFGDASGLVPRLHRSLEKWKGTGYSLSRSDRWRFLVEFAGDPGAARRLAPTCEAGLGLHRALWKLFGS